MHRKEGTKALSASEIARKNEMPFSVKGVLPCNRCAKKVDNFFWKNLAIKSGFAIIIYMREIRISADGGKRAGVFGYRFTFSNRFTKGGKQ